MPVPLGPQPPRGEPERAGGDGERSIRTRKRLAQCLDRVAIRIGGVLEPPRKCEVVTDREMDYSVQRVSCTPQAVEIIESAAMDLCPGSGEGVGRVIRSGEPGNLMAGADEFGYYGRANPARDPVTKMRMMTPPVL